MGPMSVFISHSQQEVDVKRAKRLALALEERGCRVATSQPGSDGRFGEDFELRLRHLIEEADVFLVLLSAGWADSEWCRHETELARRRAMPILPVIADRRYSRDLWPPDILLRYPDIWLRQQVDLSDWLSLGGSEYHPDFASLISALQRVAEERSGGPRASTSHPSYSEPLARAERSYRSPVKLIAAMAAGIAIVTVGLGGVAFIGNEQSISMLVGKRGEDSAQPNARRAAVATSAGQSRTAAVFEGYAWVDASVESRSFERWQSCAAACVMQDNCRAFSFDLQPFAARVNCRLHAVAERGEANRLAVAGIIDPPAGQSDRHMPVIETKADIFYDGQAVGTGAEAATSAEACKSACTASALCLTFSWRPDTKACHLTSNGEPRIMLGATSGAKTFGHVKPKLYQIEADRVVEK